MKKSIFTLLLFSSAITLSAARPQMVQYSVSTGTITSIETSQAINVEYTQSNQTSVKVVTPAEFKDKLKIKVKDGKLSTAFTKDVKLRNMEKVTVYVTAPAVTDFEANSAGSININGALNLPSQNIELEASSAGSITTGAITCANIDIESSSAASVTVAACKAKTIELESSSAASLTVKGIQATTVKGEVSSAASLKVEGNCTYSKLSKNSLGSLKSAGLTVRK